MPDQIHGWFRLCREVSGFAVPMNMHEKDSGTIKEEVIVQRGDFQPVVQ